MRKPNRKRNVMELFKLIMRRKKGAVASGDLLIAIIKYQTEGFDSVDTDEIPKVYGPFGLCETNPVPTQSIWGSDAYLDRLCTKDGQPVTAVRLGSTRAREVTSGIIDMYQISVAGVPITTIYICPYHKRNSEKAPEGFHLCRGGLTRAVPATYLRFPNAPEDHFKQRKEPV